MNINQLAWIPHPWPEGTSYGPEHLLDSELASELIGFAHVGAAKISAHGWKFLWNTYGLSGLVAITRRAECFENPDDQTITDELIHWSLLGGYDPVSGMYGTYTESDNSFELSGF